MQPTQLSTSIVPSVNRYTTEVSVELYVRTVLRRIRWFSDLQLAYIWCISEKELLDDDFPPIVWSPVKPFLEFADLMDRRWAQVGARCGCTLLYSDIYRYKVCYEPPENVHNEQSEQSESLGQTELTNLGID